MFPFDLFTRTPASARDLLRKGGSLRRLRVAGSLNLAGSAWLTELPRTLEAHTIDLSDCRRLRALPERVKCETLILRRTNITSLPAGLEVTSTIDASECEYLSSIAELRVPVLRLRECTAIRKLPEGLRVRHLDLRGCTELREFPAGFSPFLYDLDVGECRNLSALPVGLVQLRSLNLRGCTSMCELPSDIQVRSWIEVADSGLAFLPNSLRSTQVAWRGMRVPDRIAFNPDTITVDEILREPNLEYRRLLLERVGLEWFCANSRPDVIDTDTDAGGLRRLLHVAFANGEGVACLEVRCPSTGRTYLLRIPPEITTCPRAAAWLAGFNSARDYRPFLET